MGTPVASAPPLRPTLGVAQASLLWNFRKTSDPSCNVKQKMQHTMSLLIRKMLLSCANLVYMWLQQQHTHMRHYLQTIIAAIPLGVQSFYGVTNSESEFLCTGSSYVSQ